VDVGDVMPAETTSDPGARMSTQLPPFEKLLSASPRAVAATVMTEGSRAGLTVHASAAPRQAMPCHDDTEAKTDDRTRRAV
jgi:hypothetical protein